MIQELKNSLKKNAPGIATFISIMLGIASIGYGIAASREVADILDEYKEKKEEIEKKPIAEKKDTDIAALQLETGIKLVKALKKPIACIAGASTIQVIVCKKLTESLAATMAALVMKDNLHDKYLKKAEDIYGKDAAKDLKEAVYCDVPPFDEDDIQKGKRKRSKEKKEKLERYYEPLSGRMFEAYPSDVGDAVERAEKRFDKEGVLNYNKYSSILGLPDVDMGVCQDWDKDHPFRISMQIVPVEGYECIGLIPEYEPVTKRYTYLY